jgi:predicted transcriptional regulator
MSTSDILQRMRDVSLSFSERLPFARSLLARSGLSQAHTASLLWPWLTSIAIKRYAKTGRSHYEKSYEISIDCT